MGKSLTKFSGSATRSLFDTRAGWMNTPMEAFVAFVRSEEFVRSGAAAQQKRRAGYLPRDSSVRVYSAMFGKVLKHLADRGTDLLRATPADIRSFFSRDTPLTDTTRWRYLRLLERVYAHVHAELQISDAVNPASVVAQTVITRPDSVAAARREAPTACVGEDAQQRLLAVIQSLCRDGQRRSSAAAWKSERDAAMIAAMLGAGLKVAEVVGLHVERVGRVESDGSLTIEIPPAAAEGTVRWHRTRLAPFAAPLLLEWVERRDQMGMPGKLLFPSDRDGHPMDKATVYRRTRAAFERAGVDAVHLGGRTLRNSFAAREIASGGQLELVGEMLGHRERRSIERYRRAAATIGREGASPKQPAGGRPPSGKAP